jgi:hypothetical protein
MHGALTELVTTSVERLQGRRLEAEDFDRLFSDDPVKDLLLWMSDPSATKSVWAGGRWAAFRSRCNGDFGFDPERDGELAAAELLGAGEGAWAGAWSRFAESPGLYPGLPLLLRQAKPADLLADSSPSWPQNNEREENELRAALQALGNMPAPEASARLHALETHHAPRLDWVWAKLGQAPMAQALRHLARMATAAAQPLGGATTGELAARYAEAGWVVDAEALSAVAAVKATADVQAVAAALDSVYRPWLDSSARQLQELAAHAPLPGKGEQPEDELTVPAGGVVLFADGLRFDVSRQLVARMEQKGWSVETLTRWSGLPSVTATAKPAVSPVAKGISGARLGEDFLATVAESGQALSTDRFRRLLSAAEFEYLRPDETGQASGRAWTEHGELDKLGHSLQAKLAGRIDEQVELLLERMEGLFAAGWDEIRIVTDHGWLWLPGGLPKVELPKYLTESRWARCAAIKGDSRVDVPTIAWHWNPTEHVAVAPGIGCFTAGNEYAHGGLSLQECLVPVIRVTHGGQGARTIAEIEDVSWTGLRCRVRVGPGTSGLRAALRTRANDPASDVCEVRALKDDGSAGLLVADDELEGAPAVLVVLDSGGQVVAKRPTIIGGED